LVVPPERPRRHETATIEAILLSAADFQPRVALGNVREAIISRLLQKIAKILVKYPERIIDLVARLCVTTTDLFLV
ncbi:hypothetical protein, partial [Pseudomonas viridiflava]|uniref:hypothetical protein n=1 Tax=Pseudomonas viridiflava TaxID=33069 RepID=UPI0019D23DFE